MSRLSFPQLIMEGRKLALAAIFCLVFSMLPSHAGKSKSAVDGCHEKHWVYKAALVNTCSGGGWADIPGGVHVTLWRLCVCSKRSCHVRWPRERVDENGDCETGCTDGDRPKQVSVSPVWNHTQEILLSHLKPSFSWFHFSLCSLFVLHLLLSGVEPAVSPLSSCPLRTSRNLFGISLPAIPNLNIVLPLYSPMSKHLSLALLASPPNIYHALHAWCWASRWDDGLRSEQVGCAARLMCSFLVPSIPKRSSVFSTLQLLLHLVFSSVSLKRNDFITRPFFVTLNSMGVRE